MSYGVTNSSPTSLATCSDPMFGSTTVFTNDGGVCMVKDSMTVTGGQITGPGSAYVTCEDQPVSVAGDAIAAHPPCPLPPTHCAAFTTGSSNVFTGGIYPPAGSFGAGASPGQPVTPQLTVTDFTEAGLSVRATGTDDYYFCGLVGVSWLGPVKFQYTIKNEGPASTGPFKIGLYEVLGLSPVWPPSPVRPNFITITEETPLTLPNIVLIEERTIVDIGHNQEVTDTWSLELGNSFAVIPVMGNRYYVLAVDTHLQVVESIDFDNSSQVISLTALQINSPLCPQGWTGT